MKSLNHPQSRSRQQRQAGAPAPANRSLASISNSIQRHQGISAPPVYRPGNATLAAPAVHRPDASTAVQRRQGISAPPVYRPGNATVAAPAVHRPDASTAVQRRQGISAPSVYRPGNATLAAPAVHRPDASTAVQRRQGVSAPPVYRSQPLVRPQSTVGATVSSGSPRSAATVQRCKDFSAIIKDLSSLEERRRPWTILQNLTTRLGPSCRGLASSSQQSSADEFWGLILRAETDIPKATDDVGLGKPGEAYVGGLNALYKQVKVPSVSVGPGGGDQRANQRRRRWKGRALAPR